MKELEQKIQQMQLTRTEKKIADYILDNRNTIGLQTATSLAYEIGVSDTSIIRFIRALGFAGYADFKREMSARMMRQYNEALSPGQKYLKTRETLDQNNLIADVRSRAIDNILKSCEGLSMETIGQVADILLRSRRRFIMGFRGTACCADYMSRKLVFFLPDVLCCTQAESRAVERIVDIGPEDCLMIYSFPRYSVINQSLLEIARGAGASTVVVTDRITSPLAALADVTLTTSVEGLGFTNSYVAPMCISEMILLAVSSKADSDNDRRVALMDEYIGRYDLY